MKGRQYKKVLIILFSIVFSFLSINHLANAQTTKLDVVFVLDASISMRDSDPQNLRYEAIRLYMDMASAEGNRIGIVAYGGEVVGEKELTDISSEESRNDIIQYLNSLSLVHYTDTGIGLQKALEVLEASGNDEDTKKAVILLSDGKNEPERSLDQCTSDTSAALEYARGKGYPIYTIGLNADGTVDSDLLNSLSASTGGKSYITSQASDLNSILQEIYTANTTSKIIDTGASFDSGNVSAAIQIPNDSVNEAIITVMHTQPVTMSLTDPSGAAVNLPSEGVSISESTTYSIIKLSNPSQGTWMLNVASSSGEMLTVNYVLSYKMKAALDVGSSEDVKRKDTVALSLYLTSNGEKVEDPEKYNDLNAQVFIYDSSGELVEQIELEKDDTGTCFKGSCSFEKAGQYRVEGQLQGQIFYSASDPVYIDIENEPPVYIGKLKEIKLTVGREKSINLEKLFTDPDYDQLSFTADSDVEGLSIDITGSTLTLKSDSVLKGSITITADDGNGGTASQKISFSVAKMSFMYTAISRIHRMTPAQILIAAGPVAAAILIVVLVRLGNKRKKKRKNAKGGIILKGQIMLNVVDNTTGEVFPPQFLKLKNYTKGVTIFNLLSSLPEYSETEKIKLFALADNAISIKNDSDCKIMKNNVACDNSKWLELGPNDVAEIKLAKVRKSLQIKYLP